MANFYKNAFYDPTVTTAVTTYTCPSNAMQSYKMYRLQILVDQKHLKYISQIAPLQQVM